MHSFSRCLVCVLSVVLNTDVAWAYSTREASFVRLPKLSLPEVNLLVSHASLSVTTFPQFSTTVVITTTLDGSVMPAAIAGISTNETTWHVDSDRQLDLRTQNGKSGFAPSAWVGTRMEWFNSSTWQVHNSSVMVLNGACLALPADESSSTFSDPFAWVKYAQPDGPCLHSSHAKGCTRVALSVNSTAGGAFATTLVLEAVDDIPKYMSNTATCLSPKGCGPVRHNYSQDYVFYDDFKWSVDPAVFTGLNLTSCYHPTACSAPSAVPVNMSMWIFHPAHNFNISGQDVGDVAGDTFFMCEDLLQGQPGYQDHNYGWVTEWEIEMLPQWGQYQNCNGYPSRCIGMNDFLVGREAALNLGYPYAGQCTKNELTGNWFSLPVSGQCAEGGSPGDGSCTWRITRRVKTIDSLCVTKTHGMRAACALEGRAPFSKAQGVFQAAFASEDSRAGGCPAID